MDRSHLIELPCLNLQALEELNLSQTRISDVKNISCCNRLTRLSLFACTQLTDISGLEGMDRLRYISLRQSGIQDISALASLTLKGYSNITGEDFFIVPENISKIIIRELEDERTYLEKIFINNKLKLSKKELTKGQTLILDVSPFDCIRVIGYYEPLSKLNFSLNNFYLRNKIVELSNRISNYG